MRIGELSSRAGVSRDTIRFYERHGLIRSRTGTAETNNYRTYPEDALLTLDVISDAQSAGMSLADITIFLTQYLAQDDATGDVDTFLDAKITEVAARIEAATRFLQTLEQTKAALARAPQDGLDRLKRSDDPR